MKTLYLDCGMGAAGDMLTAALLGLVSDRDAVLDELNGALGGLAVVSAEDMTRCGVCGLHVKVDIAGDEEGKELRHRHAHTSIGELRSLLASAPVPPFITVTAIISPMPAAFPAALRKCRRVLPPAGQCRNVRAMSAAVPGSPPALSALAVVHTTQTGLNRPQTPNVRT